MGGFLSFLSKFTPSYNSRPRHKRRDKRLSVSNRVEIDNVSGRLVDLTVRGCGVIPDESVFRVGQDVKVTIFGRYEARIELNGSIVSSDRDALVYGIQFTKISEKSMSMIKDLLMNAERRTISS